MAIAIFLAAPVRADLSQFRGSFDGWNTSPAIAGQASLVSNLGYDDLQSLKFDMGTGGADDWPAQEGIPS